MDTKKVCPMTPIPHCVKDKCAWFVDERDACAVKVIAVRKESASK